MRAGCVRLPGSARRMSALLGVALAVPLLLLASCLLTQHHGRPTADGYRYGPAPIPIFAGRRRRVRRRAG